MSTIYAPMFGISVTLQCSISQFHPVLYALANQVAFAASLWVVAVQRYRE